MQNGEPVQHGLLNVTPIIYRRERDILPHPNPLLHTDISISLLPHPRRVLLLPVQLKQKLHFLSHPAPDPLRTEEYQTKGGTNPKQDVVGPSQAQKLLCVLRFFFVGKKGFGSLGLPQVPKSRLWQSVIRTTESRTPSSP